MLWLKFINLSGFRLVMFLYIRNYYASDEKLVISYLFFDLRSSSFDCSCGVFCLQVNGRSMVFTNCDSNPNSYMALFPNFAEQTPASYGSQTVYSFCVNLFNAMQPNPSGRVMPLEYFMFTETHWGGCGCYAQTNRGNSLSGTLAASIGFRWAINHLDLASDTIVVLSHPVTALTTYIINAVTDAVAIRYKQQIIVIISTLKSYVTSICGNVRQNLYCKTHLN